ncbi:MAG: hypothetical protein ACFFCO_06285, partial [Promethearchaeota archaeon]
MTQLTCPNCGANLSVHPSDAIITCEYCGTSFEPGGERMQKHYAMKVNFGQNEAFDTLKAYLVKVPGVSNDLASIISFKDGNMTYYPYWVTNVKGIVSYVGRDRKATFRDKVKRRYSSISWEWVDEAGREEQTRQIRQYAGPAVRREIMNYPIATRGRRYFNLKEAQKYTANIVFSRIPEDQAKQQAISQTRQMIMSRIQKETEQIDNVRESFTVTDHAYVHVPIYSIRFTAGGGKVYEAALDASNGRVLYSDIPRTTGFKLKAGFTTILWFVVAAAGGVLMIFLPSFFYLGLGLLIIALVLALMTL